MPQTFSYTLSTADITHLEHILQCAVSGQPLQWMLPDKLEEINKSIKNQTHCHLSGDIVQNAITAGFITPDERFVYAVEGGIVLATPEFAIVDAQIIEQFAHKISTYSEVVHDFYQNFGWEKSDEGVYKDTIRHVDMRPVVKDYMHRCLMRVKENLPEKGTYILDIACGAIAFAEHQAYSKNFEKRVCVDITLSALLEAQRNIPDGHGLFIIGDVVNIPLKSNLMDAAISLHTIYHVPANNQKQALDELYRVTGAGGKGIVVYSWGRHHLLWHVFITPLYFPYQVIKRLRQQHQPTSQKPQLYFHAHTRQWILQQAWDFEWRIHAWRSLSLPMLRLYIWPFLGGKALLRFIYWLEERYPVTMGRIGQYPMLIFHKNQDDVTTE